jgi:two-component system, cell cycle response regulator DivK
MRPPTVPRTILMIENDELDTKLLRGPLELRGYNVLRARDAIRAVQLALKERPDIIVLDVQLPEISGLALTRWLRGRDEFRTIPIIAVATSATENDEAAIREAGCDAYICKPMSTRNFFATIKQHLKARPGG